MWGGGNGDEAEVGACGGGGNGDKGGGEDTCVRALDEPCVAQRHLRHGTWGARFPHGFCEVCKAKSMLVQRGERDGDV